MFLSLKDNIDMVRDELNSEEKFFEKAVVTEKFLKKYKNIILSSLVAVVVVAGANMAYDINKANKIATANAALATLSKNSNDQNALSQLKDASPSLYNVWKFSYAVSNKDLDALEKLKNSDVAIVEDLVKYELAKDEVELEKYALKQDAIYRDLALVQSAVMLLNNNKIQEAHNALLKISNESPLHKLALSLLHYGIK